jgi:hypothetical protein
MTGFLMVRIIRPCIKRAQQRTLDACVLNKNHTGEMHRPCSVEYCQPLAASKFPVRKYAIRQQILENT